MNSKRYVSIIILLFIVIGTISCREEIEIRIDGIVTDASNHSPIESTKVSLGELNLLSDATLFTSTLTDEAGYYFIKYTYEGDCSLVTWYLVASKSGYNIESYKKHLDSKFVKCAIDLQTFNFELTPW